MGRRHGLGALLVSAMLSAILSSCHKPASGDKCAAGTIDCTGPKTALFCGAHGTLETMTCGGASGCKTKGGNVSATFCDQTVASVGDSCTRLSLDEAEPKRGVACDTGMKNLLICDGNANKLVLAETCKGPSACRLGWGTDEVATTSDVICDNDIADEGDPCLSNGDDACSPDKRHALACTDQKMLAVSNCGGSRGCSISHPSPTVTAVDCDTETVPSPVRR